MKTRTGFVSNSSSSSFVIASKEPLTYAKLLTVLNVPKESPLHSMSCEMAAWFVKNAERTNIKDYLDDYDCDDDDIPDIVRKALAEKMYLYTGSAADDEYGIESTICDLSLNFISDDLIIEKEDGY